jgi:hypothetical protein
MPAEANRLRGRISKRERRFLALLAAAVVLGPAGALVIAGSGSDAATPSDCVNVDQAGVMGGGTWHLCGTSAVAFCRRHAGESSQVTAQCRRLTLSSRS